MRDMQQEPLFHEDIYRALDHVVSAMGGGKVVGPELWPALGKDPARASRKLADCLNENHQQKLSVEEFIWILTEARKRGIHSAMVYLAEECGYAPPQPVEPQDEAADLQRQFVEAQKNLFEMLRRMEKLRLPSVRVSG